MLISIVVSVVVLVGKGLASLAIASNSLLSLYRPIPVMYGLKLESVAKLTPSEVFSAL
jgi:hypothetical protein